MNRPRILMLGFYPLDRLDSAPKVRITRMREALDGLCDLEFVASDRAGRRRPVRALMKRLKEFDGIYIESSTSTAQETDLLFLRAARKAGVPVAIFIRDIYQLFPDWYGPMTAKKLLLKWAWHISMARYQRDASTLFFPTEGMASYFRHPDKRLLPPAGVVRTDLDRSRTEPRVIYAGGVSLNYGIDLLLEAMALVVERLPDAKLTLICPPHLPDWIRPWLDRPWLDLKHLASDELLPEMNRARVAVIPIKPTDYPSMSVKLFEYLSYGVPVMATPWRSIADFISTHGCGEVVDADPSRWAEALVHLLQDEAYAEHLSGAALAAIRDGHAWHDRAELVLEALVTARKPGIAIRR